MYQQGHGYCNVCGVSYYGYHGCIQTNQTVPHNVQFTDRDLIIKMMTQLDSIEQKLNIALSEKSSGVEK